MVKCVNFDDRCSHLLSRSPPRPNPAGLRYSDEDICNNYNGAVSTDSTALTERAAELSESEVKSLKRHTHSYDENLKELF